MTQLPYSQGQVFENLDAYLAHLKKRGAADVPYYEKAGEGTYRLVTGRRGFGEQGEERLYTRAELEEKFGFSPAGDQ